MIRSSLAVGVAGVALVLAGCGSGDDTPATLQEQVAAAYDEQFSKISGLEVDESCIEKEAGTLSDADAQTVLDKLESGEKLGAEFKTFDDAVSACISG